MDFLISANTDVGLVKRKNQDCLSVKVMNTQQGKMTFAVLCDGMGGFSDGEIASASVVQAFEQWVFNEFPKLCDAPLKEDEIKEQWEKIVIEQNKILMSYGLQKGTKIGTTAVVLLLSQNQYYILNVGDSRVYELAKEIKQITHDQTFVAREVALGNMTQEQADKDEKKNVLLQCVGASKTISPDFFCGDLKENTAYMLCSDGFRNKITSGEIYGKFCPDNLVDTDDMNKKALSLIELNKEREEKDNISVILVKTVGEE